MKKQSTINQQLMIEILKVYTNLTEKTLVELVEKTNEYNFGYFKINGYQSELSKGTETANQLINIGMNYKKAIESDLITFDNVDLSKIDVNKFDYQYINTDGLTIDEYKQAVKDSLELALTELKQPKAKRVSNDVYLNNVLVFNYNTLKLSIIGKSESKVVETKGEFKIVKSKPLTVAKKLIENQCKGKTNSMRRFVVDNFIGNVKFAGDTIELG